VSDRTVHAVSERHELVRYDRAGNWYVERTDQPGWVPVSVVQAARFAADHCQVVHLGLPGGRTFDRLYLAMLQEGPDA
jgi:hypothetical protein